MRLGFGVLWVQANGFSIVGFCFVKFAKESKGSTQVIVQRGVMRLIATDFFVASDGSRYIASIHEGVPVITKTD